MDAQAHDNLTTAVLEEGFERALAGLVVVDGDGRVLRANQVARTLLGGGTDNLNGRSLTDLGGQPLTAAVLPVMERGEVQAHLEIPLPLVGRRALVHVHALRAETPDGHRGAFCFIRDLSVHPAEADLQGIIDRMADMFYRADGDGPLVAVSPAVVEIFGYQPDEVIGRPATAFYADPADRERFLAALGAGDGSVRGFDARMRRKDGQEIWISTTAWVIRDASGAPSGVEGLVRDVTERKAAETRAVDSRLLIQALLDASTDAIMLFRPDGALLAVNAVLAARFGRRAEDLTGQDLYALFPPAVAAARRAQVEQAVRERRPMTLVDERQGRHLHNTIHPVAGPSGAIDKVAVYSRDITDQVLAAQRIQSYIADVERSNHDLEQFAYAASHDLREPLRMIGCYVDLLERRHGRHLDPEAHEYIAIARAGVKRLDSLIRDLLEFSRIGLGELTTAEVAVDAVVARVIRDLAHLAADADATVAVVSALPPTKGSREQIAQVFQNLIANGINYRDPERPCFIEIGYRPDPALAQGGAYFVADTGVGIAPEHQERIFQVFQRLQARGETDTGGTGIGLALARRIVEHHGGRLWVESEVGRGSTFRFTLPPASAAAATT